jgi:predicted amidohydrolase
MMISPQGEITARYDKIHMFDVQLGNGESYKESDVFEPGTEAVIAQTPWGPLGMTVCYDLRFPYLYRTLAHAGAQILSVPAAFMRTTGQAHWHVLLRARAIETGCYVIAPCQNGSHGRAKTYGHSLIIDPWGEVLADGHGDEEDIIMAEIDLAKVHEARGKIPALNHDREYTVI